MKYLLIILLCLSIRETNTAQQISPAFFEKALLQLESKGEIQWRGNVIIFLTYAKAEIPFWKEMTKQMLDQAKGNPYVFAMLPRELIKKDGSYNTNDLIPINEDGRKAIAEMIEDEKFYTTGKFLLRIEWQYRYLFSLNSNEVAPYKQISAEPYQSDTIQQYWTFKKTNDGYYRIINSRGQCLQLRSQGETERNILITERENRTSDAPAQKWKIVSTINDNYFLMSKTGCYLTIPKANTDGDETTKYNIYGSSAKEETEDFRWQLIKVRGNREVLTTYKPEEYGFRFINQFSGHDFVEWSGLCGGMVNASLDFYYNKKTMPTQSWIPANATPLQSFIWHRQQHSNKAVWDKVAEYDLDVALTRGEEFFWWGTQGFNGGRLQQIKNIIDSNKPLPLVMMPGNAVDIDGNKSGKHVTLAYGYTMGRYTGNHKGHQQDYQIYIYDPNYGNRRITLIPNIAGKCYFELETSTAWLTYFINERYNYSFNTLPEVKNFPEGEADGSIRNLYAVFKIGGDDLREKSRLNINIEFKDGTNQFFENINNEAMWRGNSWHGVHLPLNKPIKKSDIARIVIHHKSNHHQDLIYDNVNVDRLFITTGFSIPGYYYYGFNGKYIVNTQKIKDSLPFHRFDSSNDWLIIPITD